MESFLLMDFVIKMFYALVTLVVFWVVLRTRDKLTGVINFKDNFERVKNDSKAYANYLGLTAIAVAIIISRFF
jgi:multisubunit Na+/H+ antiporter MnhG subunit